MSELRTYECWVYNPGCRADMVSKPEADAVLAALEEKHKKEDVFTFTLDVDGDESDIEVIKEAK